MRNFIRFISSAVFVLSLVSCSVMIEDLRNCTKGAEYVVEHYKEIKAEYKKSETDCIQTNLVKDEKGNLVPSYELVETEKFRGEVNDLTRAEAKIYEGFYDLSFDQKNILEDDSCVIRIYYNRKEVTVTVSIGEGIWNYSEKKLDSSIEDDKLDRSFTRKYGSSTGLDFDGLLDNAGKKGSSLTGYILSDGSETDFLPEYYPAENETYTAVWEEGKPASYKIIHHLEKSDSEDSNIETDENYEVIPEYTEIRQGIPETETQTQGCAKNIPGFTAKPHSEEEIASSGTTVVDIYYVRNEIALTVSIGEGLWNYSEKKLDPSVEDDKADRIFTGKYGADTAKDFEGILDYAGKKSSLLKAFVLSDGTEIESLPETYPLENETYTAVWELEKPVEYQILHYFEKLDCTDNSIETEENYEVIPEYTEIRQGIPETETQTQGCAKTIPGFSAKPHTEKEISLDGSTVIKIYYVRNEVTVTVSMGEGIWNYFERKLDPSVEEDKTDRSFTGRFGASTVRAFEGILDHAGKKSSVLKNFVLSDLSEREALPEYFPAEDVTYTAIWENEKPVNYKIVHHFEKLECTDNSIETEENYDVVPEYTEIRQGLPETETQTQDCGKIISGFTAKPHAEKEIYLTGTTVINIYYVRNEVTVTVSIGEGLWNYFERKLDPSVEEDKTDRSFTRRFGESTAQSFEGLLDHAGKKSSFLKSFVKSDGSIIAGLPESYPAADETYIAAWELEPPVNYKVFHHFEKLECTDNSVETDENYELEAAFTDTIYGLPEDETQTQSCAKTVPGFTARPHFEKEIAKDGTTSVDVYYVRNEVTVTVSIGEGLWNYSEKKQNPAIEEDKTDRSFTGRFGESTAQVFEGLLNHAGKKSSVLKNFVLSNGSVIPALPENYPAGNENYTAMWEEGQPVNYTVVHYFEKVDCTDNSVESEENYDKKSEYTEIRQGIPETETQTQSCVKNISGFTAKPHSEQEVTANGLTVVNIYYNRNSYAVEISPDEGLWNYDDWKADKTVTQDVSKKTQNGRYGTDIDWSVLNSLKKTGMKLTGLKNNDTDEVILRKDLPETIPARKLSFTAVWTVKDPVSYKVNFMTETLESADSENTSNYVLNSSDTTKTGVPEYFTEAVAKEIPGFTAKEIVQQEIKEDGSTVVYVYYKRNTSKITFDLNGGYWNYLSYRNDKTTVVPESSVRELSGKYGEAVTLPDFSEIGKRANDFDGWKNLSDLRKYSLDELVGVVTTFGVSNIVLQAQWKMGDGYEYKIRHWLENLTSNNSSDKSNYSLDSEVIEKGEEIGDETEAVAKTYKGFTVSPFAQQAIKDGGATVVDIYYTRNPSRFVFDANGGNITAGQGEVSGKYDAAFDPERTPTAAKSGWTFGGWKYNGNIVSNSSFKIENQKFDSEDKLFQAYWISTESVRTVSMFGDIVLAKTQDLGKVVCSVTLPSGYETENWTYQWYVDGVYTSNETVFTRTSQALGRGVHTITVKVTMNGQNFTQRVTATIE
ncbi:MAG: hypothetical protein MJ181_00555 [Treponema sp.]|nr:hypothetical protein [Treponema sp.]